MPYLLLLQIVIGAAIVISYVLFIRKKHKAVVARRIEMSDSRLIECSANKLTNRSINTLMELRAMIGELSDIPKEKIYPDDELGFLDELMEANGKDVTDLYYLTEDPELKTEKIL